MQALSTTVSLSLTGEIALIRIDNPPVNALSSSVVEGLGRAVRAVDGDPLVKMSILYCAGRGFIAGADLKEDLTQARSDAAASMINRIAASSKPVLAAIHGYALGGGLETALACDYRCAVDTACFGFPEVNLGAIPGYGGTQRLPRLVGLKEALAMMISGIRIDAHQALEAGLVDWITDNDLLENSLAFAIEVIAGGAPLRKVDALEVPDPALADELCETALREAAQKRRGEEAPALIVEAVRAAAFLPIQEGLAFERKRSLSRLHAPQSVAMRQKFFAQRKAK